MRKFQELETDYFRKEALDFEVGDTVNVGVVITERVEKRGKVEWKERVQVFTGVVIARKSAGINESFTVRRIVAGEGVERVFPVHSPQVSYVKVVRKARVRRAKLYYLRERSGKSARLRERFMVRARKSAGGDKS